MGGEGEGEGIEGGEMEGGRGRGGEGMGFFFPVSQGAANTLPNEGWKQLSGWILPGSSQLGAKQIRKDIMKICTTPDLILYNTGSHF